MTALTTLIVEDDDAVRGIWVKFLSPVVGKSNIREARNLREAIWMMNRIPPADLILLDLRLPDSMKADDTIAEIQTFRRVNPRVVIIVITGAMDAYLPDLARTNGADGFFPKESVIGQAKLLESIKHSCEHQTTEERIQMIARISDFMATLNPSNQ